MGSNIDFGSPNGLLQKLVGEETPDKQSPHPHSIIRHLTLWICWVLGGLGGLWGEVLSSRRKVANSRRMGSSWGESYVYKGI